MRIVNWIACIAISLFLLGVATPGSAQTASEQRAAGSREATELLQKRLAFLNVNEAVSRVIQAQQAYGVARAAGHQFAMHNMAAELIASLAEARYWTRFLDRLVTAAEFNQQVDQDVADLNGIVGNALSVVLDAAIADDLGKLDAALDTSGDTFNRLERTMRNLNANLWPQLSEQG